MKEQGQCQELRQYERPDLGLKLGASLDVGCWNLEFSTSLYHPKVTPSLAPFPFSPTPDQHPDNLDCSAIPGFPAAPSRCKRSIRQHLRCYAVRADRWSP